MTDIGDQNGSTWTHSPPLVARIVGIQRQLDSQTAKTDIDFLGTTYNAELHMIIEPVWTKKENKYVCKNYDLKANKILYIFKNKDII